MFKKILPVIAAFALLTACGTKEGADLYGNENGGWSDDVNISDLQSTDATKKFAAEVPTIVYFRLDSSDLTTEAREHLTAQADWLKSHERTLALIEGRCDERGTREYNLALGERRANAARSYLIAKGVKSDRIRTISYGKEKPVVLGSTDEAWAKNRNANTIAY